MKRKILIVALLVISLIACVFGFSACIADSENGGNTDSNTGNSGIIGGSNGSDDTDDNDDNGNQFHRHSYNESVIAPTCTEQGYTLHTCDCGDNYKDNYTSAIGHTEVIDSAVAPTCIKTGLTEGKHCSVCKTVLIEQKEVPLIEHNFVNNSCVVCGKLKPTEGLKYTLSSDGGYYICSGMGTATETEIVIASEYNGKPVKEIAHHAFYVRSELTSITIPDSIIVIGIFAFDNCTGLKEVHISDLGAWCNVNFEINRNGGYVGREINSSNPLYYAQNIYLNDKHITELAIPDDVSHISDRAFIGCSSLTSVTIPNSVTFIGDSAFTNCSRLIIYSEAMSKPSGWSDDWNKSLCPVVWDCTNNDKDESGYAYANFAGIRYSLKDGVANVIKQPSNNIVEAIIPSSVNYKGSNYSVTFIGAGAFEDCIGLTMITIGKSVISIGDNAFDGCRGLTIYSEATSKPSGWNKIICPVVWDCNNNDKDENGYAYTVIDGIRYSLKDGVANVIEQPRNIVKAIIPATVNYKGSNYSITYIGENAFEGCSGLTSITFPDGVTSIGSGAFGDCSGLTSITIPDSVTSIGSAAFVNCSGLTSVTIGNGVASIGIHVFYNCRCLMDINYNGTIAQWKVIDKFLWNLSTGNYIVHCVDGDITKSES